MEDELKYSYNVLRFDLSAGLTDFEVPIHAERVDYVSPTDGPELSIRLQRKSNDQLPLRPNGSIEAPFTRLYISAAAVARTVFLMVGAPSEVRVTGRDVALSGSVNIVERLAYEGSAGRVFERTHLASVAALGALFTQILNPAGSGITVELIAIETTCSDTAGTQGTQYGQHNTALTTLVGAGRNHLLGGAASVAQIRSQSSGALGVFWGQLHSPAFTPRRLDLSVFLAPGNGFGTLVTSSNAFTASTRYLFREY